MTTRVAPSADASKEAVLGEGASIWRLAQVREHAVSGRDYIMGRDVYIGEGVVMGNNYEVQNCALVYELVRLTDGIFVGPAVTLTNGRFPRAVSPDGSLKSATDQEPMGVAIEQGASIGAHAMCVTPVCIGIWATMVAGVVVTKDVPAHTLVAGIPARRIDWVGHAGKSPTPSDPDPDGAPRWRYPVAGTLYEQFGAEPAVRSGSQSSSESTTIREVTHWCHASSSQQPS